MKRGTLCIWLLLVIQVSYAQDCLKTLSGSVIDFHDGLPLEGATISYNNITIQTDAEGKYSIPNLCEIAYAFTIAHENCNSQVVTINVQEITHKDFYLEHHLSELGEVKIASIQEQLRSSYEGALDKNDIERYSAASLGDALKEITGVSSINTGSTIVKPVVQGLYGSRITIVNNGVRMQDMEWGEEHAPNIDINTAGSVTLVEGASALQYGGDAIGGVILMKPTKVPLKDTLFGKLHTSFSTLGRGNATTAELSKGYKSGSFFKVQGMIKKFGDVEAPDYVLSNTGIEGKGASISFGKNKFEYGWDVFYSYFENEIGILSAAHLGNTNNLIEAINSREPRIIRDFTYAIDNPRQDVNHHLGRVNYFKRFEKLGKLNIQYDFQKNSRKEFDIRRGEELSKKPSVDLELTTHTLSTDFKFDSKPNYTVNVGFMGRYQENFASGENGVRRLIPDYEKIDAAGFLIATVDIADGLTYDGGVRYDFNYIDALKFYRKSTWEDRGYNIDFAEFEVRDAEGSQLLTNPVYEFHNFSTTHRVQYEFNNYRLAANYALAKRAPNPAELFSDGLHHSAARIENGDLRIGQETSHKMQLSLQKNGTFWRWKVAPYVNFVQDYILIEPTSVRLSIRGSFPVWDYRAADSRFIGLDMNTSFHWSDQWRTDHSFSIVKGKEIDTDTPLINIPPPSLRNKVSYTKEKLNLSLESEYNFRQNEYPDNIMVFSSAEQKEVPLDINTPPDAYHLLHFSSDYSLDTGTKSTLKIGVDIHNILNTTYRNYLNRLRFFADDLGRNITVRLSINY